VQQHTLVVEVAVVEIIQEVLVQVDLQVLEVLELEEIEVLLEQLVQLILVAVEVEVDLIVNNHQKMLVGMVVQVLLLREHQQAELN
jgi:hypothetical protein